MVCFHPQISDEPLERDALPISEPSIIGPFLGRQLPRIPAVQELKTQSNQVSFLEHDSCGDVDVEIHPALGWADGLEVSAPELHTPANRSAAFISEKGTRVERESEIRFHANGDIESLARFRGII